MSSDGINWLRGDGLVEGHRSAAEQSRDVGVVLGPNSDNWWTLDTAHLSVSDVQVGSGGIRHQCRPTCLGFYPFKLEATLGGAGVEASRSLSCRPCCSGCIVLGFRGFAAPLNPKPSTLNAVSYEQVVTLNDG